MADDEFADSSGDARLPDELVGQLRTESSPFIHVPEDVDRAILTAARAYFAGQATNTPAAGGRPNRRAALPWLSISAALAATLLLAVWLAKFPREADQPAVGPVAQPNIAREDLDRNGQVDILDAFLLARHVERNTSLDADWDMNGDGRVTYDDVHVIAQSAVRLTQKG